MACRHKRSLPRRGKVRAYLRPKLVLIMGPAVVTATGTWLYFAHLSGFRLFSGAIIAVIRHMLSS